jgi:hypothetical protein
MMAGDRPALPLEAFDEVVKSLLRQFGDDWIKDASANRAFMAGTASLLREAST